MHKMPSRDEQVATAQEWLRDKPKTKKPGRVSAHAIKVAIEADTRRYVSTDAVVAALALEGFVTRIEQVANRRGTTDVVYPNILRRSLGSGF